MEPVPLSDALWAATTKERFECDPLSGSMRVDVGIVGAGITGLSAALHLAEAGVHVAVIDALAPGHGASGRSGGQVIPGLKLDPRQLKTTFGVEMGAAMIETAGGAADLVFDLVKRHRIQCDATQSGWIQAVHHVRKMAEVKDRFEDWASHGAPVTWLERDHIRDYCQSDLYLGGWIDRRGGALQPYAYCMGLARAASAAGAAIHSDSRVQALTQEPGGWRAVTNNGDLHADQILLCSNAYADDIWLGLKRSVVPVYSLQIATEPLSDRFKQQILRNGEVCSDTRDLLWYFRQDADGRLLLGGAGGLSADPLDKLYNEMAYHLARLLPERTERRLPYRWAGQVAVTPDRLPRLHELAPGLWTGFGYNGRGIAMATRMGQLLSQCIAGDRGNVAFPITPVQPFRSQPLAKLGAGLLRGYYRLRQARDN